MKYSLLLFPLNVLFSTKRGRITMRKKIEDDYKGGLGGGGLYLPKTFHQGLYVKHLQDPRVPLVFGVGPAGSGKTLFCSDGAI
jgi:phosphate starvation-inducible protein PhoH